MTTLPGSSSVTKPVHFVHAFALTLLLSGSSTALHSQSIQTIAGGGTNDGERATQAALGEPAGVAVDRFGNIYFAEQKSHRVRKIADGIVTTVAGDGAAASPETLGDGKLATRGQLNQPVKVALDTDRNIYIADSQNHRVRKVTISTGLIETIAGTGVAGRGADGVAGTTSAVNLPSGVAVDSTGNVFFSDQVNSRVRRIDAVTKFVTTVAGTGTFGLGPDISTAATSVQLAAPAGLAIDASGALYIADTFNHRIRKVTNGQAVTIAGSGPGSQGSFSGDGGSAVAARLNQPLGVAIDSVTGTVYIADTRNNRVRAVSPGGIINTLASALFRLPADVSVDTSGNILVADFNNRQIRKIDAVGGTVSTIAGIGTGFLGDGLPATAASLAAPQRVVVDQDGNLFIADRENHSVRRVDAITQRISTYAGTGIADLGNDNLPATSSALSFPSAIALDLSGHLFIADTDNHRIRRVDRFTGQVTTVAGDGFPGDGADGVSATASSLSSPEGIAFDSTGTLFIADSGNHKVRKIVSGVVSRVAGNGTPDFLGDNGPATSASLNRPVGLAFDASGNLLIADELNHRVRSVTPSGTISTFAGGGTGGDGAAATLAVLNQPADVAIDRSGNVFIAEFGRHNVRMVAAGSRVISTFSGSGTPSFTGDLGVASGAGLRGPRAITIDALGNIYISDQSNNRIRAVLACVSPGPVTLTAPADQSTPAELPRLEWNSVKGAFRYDVRLDTVNPPVKVVAENQTATFLNVSNLNPGITYFWQVVAKGDPFCPATFAPSTSAVRRFNTAPSCDPPELFTQTTPAVDSTVPAPTVNLTWAATRTPGVTYEVSFGPSNPPPVVASGLTATSFNATGTIPGTTYYWSVTARTTCDPTKSASTAIRSFRVAGACAAAGPFVTLFPSSGATAVSTSSVALSWSGAVNARSYDLFFGTSAEPPIFSENLTQASTVISALEPNTAYFWRVVAKVPCDPEKSSRTSVLSFRTTTVCPTPDAPQFEFVPENVSANRDGYVILWKEVGGIDAGGGYRVERAVDSGFTQELESQETTLTHATFLPRKRTVYYHRVRAVSSCSNTQGPVSATGQVNVIDGKPSVVFSTQPQPMITNLGDKLEDRVTKFKIENNSGADLSVILGQADSGSNPFFTIRDSAGQRAVLVNLLPRIPQEFQIHYSGPPVNTKASYQGLIVVAGGNLQLIPYAFVNLKVGGEASAVPRIRKDGKSVAFASFPGFENERDDKDRDPLTIEVFNPGPGLMELGAEIGPEAWLTLVPGWNTDPIQPNTARTIQMKTRRNYALNGSALPRYTYLTLRTKSGESDRILIQDNDRLPPSNGRGGTLGNNERTSIIPLVLTAPEANGVAAASVITLTNSSDDDVQAGLVFTPLDSSGFDSTKVKLATVIVPKHDVVALVDPLKHLFELQGAVTGTVEVRTDSKRVLKVESQIVTTLASGKEMKQNIPTTSRGEGARRSSPSVLPGLIENSQATTSLSLVETTGKDRALVKLSLFDSNGSTKGTEDVEVPAYGLKVLDAIVTRLQGGADVTGARLEVSVASGSGSVVGLATVRGRASATASTIVASPITMPAALAKRAALNKGSVSINSGDAITAFIPVVVNGPVGGASFPSRTIVGIAAPRSGRVEYRLTFKDGIRAPITRPVIVEAGRTMQFANVLSDLFGITPPSQGRIEIAEFSGTGGRVFAQLTSDTGLLNAFTPATEVPIIPVTSESLTGGAGVQRPVYIDGVDQSTDGRTGRVWSLYLTEVGGSPVKVAVRVYEAGNRVAPIVEKEFDVAGGAQVKLEPFFSMVGLEGADRNKDRTNMLMVVTPVSGNGKVSAMAVSLDRESSDSKNLLLTPSGGVPASGLQSFTEARELPPELQNPAPTVRAVTPGSGSASGGTAVTIVGNTFKPGLTVLFGTSPATNVERVSPTEIKAVAPAGSGKVDVIVRNSDGKGSMLTEGFSYEVAAVNPTITSITPSSGSTEGGLLVTITGTSFAATPSVTFGGTPATEVTFSNSTTVTARTPARAAGAVVVVLTNPDGREARSSASGFTYVVPPVTITSIAPASGPVAGGTVITISGSGFQDGVSVVVGGAAATGVSRTATTITATTPAHAAGSVDVVVTNPGGTPVTRSNGFTYVPPGAPTFTSISPVKGPVDGGTAVTITGSNFRPGVIVRFGGIDAATPTVNAGGTSITTTTPRRAAGSVEIAIVNSDATSISVPGAFTYENVAPSITSIAPQTGATRGGTLVAISGTGFREGVRVFFGGVAGNIQSSSGTAINVLTPEAPAGTVEVRVVNVDGLSATLAAAFTYTVPTQPPPVINSLSPSSGSTAGGTRVTIVGSNFQAGAVVTIGGVAATAVVVDPNGAQITATTGARATAGVVDVLVMNPQPNGQSAVFEGGFVYVEFRITDVVDASNDNLRGAPAAGGTIVRIKGQGFSEGVTVLFGGTAATGVTIVSAMEIRATTPAHAPGLVVVVVGKPNGESASIAGKFAYRQLSPMPGDADGNAMVSVADVFYLINMIFANGPAPVGSGNANGDAMESVADVFYIINFLFANGPAPL